MKKKSVISGRPKITDQSQDHCVDDTFCPKITVWTVALSTSYPPCTPCRPSHGEIWEHKRSNVHVIIANH